MDYEGAIQQLDRCESLLRLKLALNNRWLFQKNFDPVLHQKNYTGENLEPIRLPHSVVETPFHYFSEDLYQMVSGYRRELFIPKTWQGKCVRIHFEGAAHHAKVYMNGQFITEHFGGYTAFDADVSHAVLYGEENVLTVELDSRESLNIPPFGHVIDYMTYGGLYREVFVEVLNNNHMVTVFAHGQNLLTQHPQLAVEVVLNQPLEASQGTALRFRLFEGETLVDQWESNTLVGTQHHGLQAVKLWDIDHPVLYRLKTELLVSGRPVDSFETVLGFREAHFQADGFYLNGKKIKLRGLNRHQSYPYVGYAMPKGPQVNDANLLKHELGVNMVRTSHYPQSHHFLNRCDELGLLVFTELPGWQHIGDEGWKQVALQSVEEMVVQYRNHPSVVIWGVRINESQDDDAFYKETNARAHDLDPYRQTGGVRYIKKSSLLEDVYTYNDFLHQGHNPGVDSKATVTPDAAKGYLITEFNGHMYPTKSFDTAKVRVEHALRHAKVLDHIYQLTDFAGGIGWCMFDYNTHKDFGSGDGVCYHGVMDMFRNPKLAAAVYNSQKEPDELNPSSVVLEVASNMGIGDYPGGYIGDVHVFTNGEGVNLYKNGHFIKHYSSKDTAYPHLPHGPITLDDFIGDTMEKAEGYSASKASAIKEVLLAGAKYGQGGLPLSIKLKVLKLMLFHGFKIKDAMRLYGKYIGNWGEKVTTYTFEAVLGNKPVKRVNKGPVEQIVLQVNIDETELIEETSYAVSSVRIRAVDQNGQVLPYYQEPLFIQLEGPFERIGPEIITLKGGMGGTYIRTTGIEGQGTLTISPVKGCVDTEPRAVVRSLTASTSSLFPKEESK